MANVSKKGNNRKGYSSKKVLSWAERVIAGAVLEYWVTKVQEEAIARARRVPDSERDAITFMELFDTDPEKQRASRVMFGYTGAITPQIGLLHWTIEQVIVNTDTGPPAREHDRVITGLVFIRSLHPRERKLLRFRAEVEIMVSKMGYVAKYSKEVHQIGK